MPLLCGVHKRTMDETLTATIRLLCPQLAGYHWHEGWEGKTYANYARRRIGNRAKLVGTVFNICRKQIG